jgi:hypothetical protein
MIQTCSKCKNYDISISDEPCRECQKAFRRGEGKPNFIASITNADRIRSMTDEELAEWIANEIWKAFAQGAGNPFFNQDEAVKLENQEWLDWLRKGVE